MERYDISDHDCPCSKGVLGNGKIRTPLLQGQSWSLISYLSIAQNPFPTGTVVEGFWAMERYDISDHD
jgi:hypothetical protein